MSSQDLQDAIEELVSRNVSLHHRIQGLAEQNDTLQTRNDKFGVLLQNFETENESLLFRLQRLGTENNKLQTINEELGNQIQTLEIRNDNLTAGDENLKRDYETLKRTKTALKVAAESTEKSLHAQIALLEERCKSLDSAQRVARVESACDSGLTSIVRIKPDRPDEKPATEVRFGEIIRLDSRRVGLRKNADKDDSEQRTFHASSIYDDSVQTKDILQSLLGHLDAVVQGFNLVFFVQGSSGAGKTYTLAPQRAVHEGLISMMGHEIFESLRNKAAVALRDSRDFSFHMTLLAIEFAGEVGKDLLVADDDNEHDKIELKRSDHLDRYQQVHDEKELDSLLRSAMDRRESCAQAMNKHSSRTHVLISLKIHQSLPATGGDSQKPAELDQTLTSRIAFLDFAGNEPQLAETDAMIRRASSGKHQSPAQAVKEYERRRIQINQDHVKMRALVARAASAVGKDQISRGMFRLAASAAERFSVSFLLEEHLFRSLTVCLTCVRREARGADVQNLEDAAELAQIRYPVRMRASENPRI